MSYQVISRKITASIEPRKFFERICQDQKNAVWLDNNATVSNGARYSYIGYLEGPLSYLVTYDVNVQKVIVNKNSETITKNMSIFEFLKSELAKYQIEISDLPFNFIGGFIGYLGYELKKETSHVTNLKKSDFPDAKFLFLDRVIVFDHQEQNYYLVCLSTTENDVVQWFEYIIGMLEEAHIGKVKEQRKHLVSEDLFYSQQRQKYLQNVDKCLAYIQSGDCYEICLTNRMHINGSIDPFKYYSILRNVNPTPYSAFLQFKDFSIASSSMERFLFIDKDGTVETRPIKGTAPRGNTEQEDQFLQWSLANDEKSRAENLMIVDLSRNDLGKVCEIGSIHVPTLMQVESYATVHQLVSTIKGIMKSDIDAVDCIKSIFPGGSMTGAPKIRALEIIDELEEDARGIYSGTIGYFSVNGTADFNIVIRTAVITSDRISIGIGGAIVDESNPEKEYQETLLKAKSLLVALREYVA